MKPALILAGAITLVLISMESPAFGSPAPPNEAIASLMSDTLIDNEGLVRQKRGTGARWARCHSTWDCDQRRNYECRKFSRDDTIRHCLKSWEGYEPTYGDGSS